MTKKKAKRRGIPLKKLLLNPSFRRNYDALRHESDGDTDPKLKAAVEDMIFEQAESNARSAERHARASSKGGKSASEQTSKNLKDRNDKIIRQANLMLAEGKPRRGLAGRLARRFTELSERQINNILQDAGI